MKTELNHLEITAFETERNVTYVAIPLSYEVFGPSIGTAPVVLVNHALTGNSTVTGELGWWKELIGNNKLIDTACYTVIAFNIPGNGYDDFLIESYKHFTARDIARIFKLGLVQLNIQQLFAAIGGSIGGGIAWELGALYPDLIENIIPIASDWKATDWLIANTRIQEQILKNSSRPVHDARMHAMNLYRTPESYQAKFKRTTHKELNQFNVEAWLQHHGEKLEQYFNVTSYKLLNHLLSTLDITRNKGSFLEVASSIKSNIFMIGIDSDLFFTAKENKAAFLALSGVKANVYYGEIQSIHGHDAFLIEFKQIESLLEQLFNKQFKVA
jgi:homoserine O-acetyltransferase